MKRATVGSLVFIGGTLFFCISPGESPAMAGAPIGVVARGLADERALPTAAEETILAVQAAQRTAVRVADRAATTGDCAEGMVEVEGDSCPDIEQKCLKYIDPEGAFPRRCAEFAPSGPCLGKTTKKHFCMDRFEYPNRVGAKPVVMKTWYEAADACRATGKRLCGDSEWTLACEGQEHLPYPYGLERNAEACNIDKPHPNVNEPALANPFTRDAEVERLWQGEDSGTRDSCVSPYGVFDMTGNVDEWVVNESGMPYKSGLKGGYWGPVRDRCRPMTTAHYEQFAFYQIGFRCCADAPADDMAAKNGSDKAPERARKGAPGTKTVAALAGS